MSLGIALGRGRLLVATTTGVVALSGAWPAMAYAHVGELKTAVVAGPYRLSVTALPVRVGGRVALAFHSKVSSRATGTSVSAGHARIVVHEASGAVRGPYEAPILDGYAGVYVPIRAPDSWRRLRFVIEITGPDGTASGLYVPPNLFRQWLPEPLLFALAGAASILFLQGFVRLRRRGRRDHAPVARLALFVLGLCLLVLPLVSPLDVVGDHFLLSAHMLQHVLIGDAAPAVILVALRGPLLYFVVPPMLLRRLGRSSSLRLVASWLSRPKVALILWTVAYYGWHLPFAYDYAATHQDVHDLEHVSFVLAGFLIWNVLVDPGAHGRLSRGQRLAFAIAVLALGTVIADALIFSSVTLYPLYASQAERVFELSPLEDQRIAGLVMTVEQLLTVGTCATILLRPLVRVGSRARRGQSTATVSAP